MQETETPVQRRIGVCRTRIQALGDLLRALADREGGSDNPHGQAALAVRDAHGQVIQLGVSGGPLPSSYFSAVEACGTLPAMLTQAEWPEARTRVEAAIADLSVLERELQGAEKALDELERTTFASLRAMNLSRRPIGPAYVVLGDEIFERHYRFDDPGDVAPEPPHLAALAGRALEHGYPDTIDLIAHGGPRGDDRADLHRFVGVWGLCARTLLEEARAAKGLPAQMRRRWKCAGVALAALVKDLDPHSYRSLLLGRLLRDLGGKTAKKGKTLAGAAEDLALDRVAPGSLDLRSVVKSDDLRPADPTPPRLEGGPQYRWAENTRRGAIERLLCKSDEALTHSQIHMRANQDPRAACGLEDCERAVRDVVRERADALASFVPPKPGAKVFGPHFLIERLRDKA